LLRNGKAYESDIYLGKGPLKNTTLAQTPSFQTIGKQLGLTKPVTGFNMYMGAGIHKSGLHYDLMDNTLMQLHGAKKVVLFPPSQIYNLYPIELYHHFFHGMKLRSCFSRVSTQKPDLETFPKLEQALEHKQEVIVHSHETLYIPSGWWHDVIALGDEMVCSVSRFWRVYPSTRALLSWSRYRSVIGFFCAMPYTTLSLIGALFGSNKKQKISDILYRI
ncbi:MAG: cupin-like domain-containing protein, partial [Symploca sp. SIO1C4]|nr:cupin-like domain-containing protein [Symploca sp. SIO1C4]